MSNYLNKDNKTLESIIKKIVREELLRLNKVYYNESKEDFILKFINLEEKIKENNKRLVKMNKKVNDIKNRIDADNYSKTNFNNSKKKNISQNYYDKLINNNFLKIDNMVNLKIEAVYDELNSYSTQLDMIQLKNSINDNFKETIKQFENTIKDLNKEIINISKDNLLEIIKNYEDKVKNILNIVNSNTEKINNLNKKKK